MTRKARHTEDNRRGVPLFVESGGLRLRLIRIGAAVLFGVGVVSQAILVTGFELGPPTAASLSSEAPRTYYPSVPDHSAAPSVPVPGFAGGVPTSEFTDPLSAPHPSNGGAAPPPNSTETSTEPPVLAGQDGSPQQAAAPTPRQQRGNSGSAPGATNRPSSNPHN